MKKLLSVLIAFTLIFSTCFMGLSVQANALEASPEADFIFFEGVIEEYIGPGGVVVIPQSIEGEKVTEIAQGAFSNNEDIEEVHIPEGIEIIGRRAFYYCSNLTVVTLPYTLQELRASTFAGCAIEEIVIPGNVDFIGNWCFANCNLNKITISYGVRRILEQAFCGNPTTDVVFPETVEVIMASAFSPSKDKERATYTICNPNVEFGVAVDGQSEAKAENSEWNGKHGIVFASPYGNVNYTLIVPENSNLHEFLQKNNNGKDLYQAAGGNYVTCSYSIRAEDEAYFDSLPENQKDWGITKLTGELWSPSSSGSQGGVQNGTQNGSQNGTQNGTQNDIGGVQNGNVQNGGQDNVQTIYDDGGSATWIILVVAVVVVLLIAGVVIFLIIFLKKPSNKNNALTDEEMLAVLQARMAAKEADAEAPAEEPTENEE